MAILFFLYIFLTTNRLSEIEWQSEGHPLSFNTQWRLQPESPKSPWNTLNYYITLNALFVLENIWLIKKIKPGLAITDTAIINRKDADKV